MAEKRVTCYNCHGERTVLRNTRDTNGNYVTVRETCGTCSGTGKVVNPAYSAEKAKEERQKRTNVSNKDGGCGLFILSLISFLTILIAIVFFVI